MYNPFNLQKNLLFKKFEHQKVYIPQFPVEIKVSNMYTNVYICIMTCIYMHNDNVYICIMIKLLIKLLYFYNDKIVIYA